MSISSLIVTESVTLITERISKCRTVSNFNEKDYNIVAKKKFTTKAVFLGMRESTFCTCFYY